MNVRIPFLARLRAYSVTLAGLRDRLGRKLRFFATKTLGPPPAPPTTSRPAEATVMSEQTNPGEQSLSFSFTSPSGRKQPAEMVVHRISTAACAIPTTRTTTQGNAGLPHNAESNAED